MAKIYGLFGAMTGKVADAVMVVRNGEQIVRKYQPVVSNPSTVAQVEARAKLKMLSQLSAVMAPVIAIRKQGAVSSRNLFTKVNYPAASFSGDTAEIELSAVKITKSVVSLPEISVTVSDATINAQLLTGVASISRVVYCCFRKAADNTLRFEDSKVISEAGDQAKFPASFTLSRNSDYVIYAYGVRDNNEAASVVFGDLEVVSAETIAKVITSRALSETDITVTETKFAAANIPASRNDDEKKETKKK